MLRCLLTNLEPVYCVGEPLLFEFDSPRSRTIISLTPLIDVVFILLLFFMLATEFDTERSFVVSASSSTTTRSTSDDPGKLQRLDDATLSLDGEILDEGAIEQELLRRYRQDQSYAIIVSVANGISVQSLLELIALTKKTGIQHITIGATIQAAKQ